MPRPRLRFLLLALLLIACSAACAFADLAKLDPRARIALAELQGGTALTRLKELQQSVNAAGDLDVFVVGDVTRAELELAGATVRTALPGIFTAFIPVSAIDAVSALPGVTAIRGAAPVEPENDVSVPTTGAAALRGAGPSFTGLSGTGVLVGDVDTGVNYSHGDFKDALGNSRFVSIWDQTVAGTFPAGFAYGNECTNAQLTAGTCTEKDIDGHGSHVMGTAGGDGSQGLAPYQYAGMAPTADLCMVKTNFSTTGILDGVAYIFGRATALGKNCVVNLSLGSHFGSHDGNSPFEAGLSSMCGPGRIIVKSAGNERSTTNIRHAQVLAAGIGTGVTVLVSGSAAGRTLAFDGYYEATEVINVKITTPSGTVIGPLSLGGINAGYPGTGTPNGNVYLENGASVTTGGAREVYCEINAVGTTSNGTWTFTFIPVSLGATNGKVDLWRFFNSTSFNGNFVIGADNGEMLVSEPGNAVQLITTAAWTSRQVWTACNGVVSQFSGTTAVGTLATFSSMGPTRDGRLKPDISAPGIAIASVRSFDVAGTCPASGATTLVDGGNHTVNAGTSMAAPHTSGAAAILMQKFGAVTPAFIKSYLSSHAIVDGLTGAVPNKDWGYGKLFLGDLVDPTVSVVVPNGGETWVIGSGATLQWTAVDNVGVTSVDLELSRNGSPEGPWETIALGAPNTGSLTWTVTGPVASDAIVRVTARDAAGNAGSDVSDAVFEILDGATGTLLSLFEAEPLDQGLALRWRFGSDAGFQSVSLERSSRSVGPWESVNADRHVEDGVTVAVDRSAVAGETYLYRLRAVTANGQVQMFGPLSGTAGRAVTEFALEPVTPNPTVGLARVEFSLPRASDVKLSVLDLQGREVATLASGAFRPGRYQAVWTGKFGERTAPAGVYFVRFQTPERSFVRRLVLAR